jgi:tRNA pseudouridine55 synthase
MDLIINLNKTEGLTSQEATTEVKRILKARKAGHTGTLDPMATGVLLVCTNRATRLASYFSSLDKEYTAVMKLGETTDTQDSTGRTIKKTKFSDIERSKIEDLLISFKGRVRQIPPMFSALKHKGKPLYKYARRGEEVQRDCREVNIYDIELLDIDLPFVTFRVVCSKGTYIRTLCNDIGEQLGVGAHLYRLIRTAIGPFSIKDSISIDTLTEAYKTGLESRGIYRMDEALSWMPDLTISDDLVRSVKNGVPLRMDQVSPFTEDMKSSDGIRIKSPDGRLLAIGSFFKPKRIIRMDVVFGT